MDIHTYSGPDILGNIYTLGIRGNVQLVFSQSNGEKKAIAEPAGPATDAADPPRD